MPLLVEKNINSIYRIQYWASARQDEYGASAQPKIRHKNRSIMTVTMNIYESWSGHFMTVMTCYYTAFYDILCPSFVDLIWMRSASRRLNRQHQRRPPLRSLVVVIHGGKHVEMKRLGGYQMLSTFVWTCLNMVQQQNFNRTNKIQPDLSWAITSSTAQGGGGSFKNRKPIGEAGCCESGMAERSHWLTERWLELCLLEWLQWLQWSPHPQLLDVVWCTATVVVVIA